MSLYRPPQHYFVKIQIFNDTPHFGSGVIAVMEQVKKGCSLRVACQDMGIAYSKVWRLIKEAEADLGFVLIQRTSGGRGGGGSKLTAEGEELLDRFQQFEREAKKHLDRLFTRYFSD